MGRDVFAFISILLELLEGNTAKVLGDGDGNILAMAINGDDNGVGNGVCCRWCCQGGKK